MGEDRGGGGWGVDGLDGVKVRERLVGVGELGGVVAGEGVDEWRASLCHRCNGQLQLECAPMHRRWSVQRC